MKKTDVVNALTNALINCAKYHRTCGEQDACVRDSILTTLSIASELKCSQETVKAFRKYVYNSKDQLVNKNYNYMKFWLNNI